MTAALVSTATICHHAVVDFGRVLAGRGSGLHGSVSYGVPLGVSSNAPPVLEGHLVTNLVFGIHFSAVSDVPIVFTYATTEDVTLSGMYTNPPGVTNAVLKFSVDGNVTPESNRVLNVTLSDPYLLSYPWPRIELGQAPFGRAMDSAGLSCDVGHTPIGPEGFVWSRRSLVLQEA